MSVRLLRFLVIPVTMLGFSALSAPAAQDKDNAQAKEAIAKNAEGFIEAFQKGDAKAAAAFWTKDGDYSDQTGRHIQGRPAIEKAFQTFFSQHKGLKLRINSDSLRFVTPDVAIEDGTTEVISADGGPPTKARFTIVHVKKDGYWYLSSVRDSPYSPPSNRDHFQGLEWALGDWSSDPAKPEVDRLAFTFSEGDNWVLGSFSMTAGGASVGQMTVWIGWDPAAKRIRSWSFDATGGFGEGTWTQDGKKWVIKSTSVHADGKKAATTYVLGYVDADTISLQAKDRTVDGKPIPDTKEIKLKRVK